MIQALPKPVNSEEQKKSEICKLKGEKL